MKKLFMIAVATVALMRCQPDNRDARICVDAKTRTRVDASECQSADTQTVNSFLWYYVLFSSTNQSAMIPPVGQTVSGSSFTTKPTEPEEETVTEPDEETGVVSEPTEPEESTTTSSSEEESEPADSAAPAEETEGDE